MRLNFLSVLDWLAAQGGDCLLCGVEPDASVVLELVRSLRRHGQALPVVVIGPHSAFRAAVDVARLSGTDFLQRPVSAQALHKVTAVAAGRGDEHE